MKRIWILIGGFILGSPIGSFADAVKQAPPPKVEESTPDQDKAALDAASSDADKWAASHKEKPAAPKPVETPTQAASPSPAASKASAPPPAASPTPAPATAAKSPDQPIKPPTRRVGLNEMKGKLLSIGSDPKTLRLIVDGGYNVEFSFDTKTSVVNGGEPVKIDDLGYNDVLVVRYSGKELYAIEIERISKAPRPE